MTSENAGSEIAAWRRIDNGAVRRYLSWKNGYLEAVDDLNEFQRCCTGVIAARILLLILIGAGLAVTESRDRPMKLHNIRSTIIYWSKF